MKGIQKALPKLAKYSYGKPVIDSVEKLIELAFIGDIQDFVKYLDEACKYAPDILNICDELNGNVPLHIACSRGHLEMISLLIRRRANVNFQDIYGNTPLIYAVDKNQMEACEQLLKAGADITRSDFQGNSPLHVAVGAGNPEMIQLLLTFGADACTTFKNFQNEMPKDKTKNLVIIKLLETFRSGGPASLRRISPQHSPRKGKLPSLTGDSEYDDEYGDSFDGFSEHAPKEMSVDAVKWMGFGLGIGVGIGMAVGTGGASQGRSGDGSPYGGGMSRQNSGMLQNNMAHMLANMGQKFGSQKNLGSGLSAFGAQGDSRGGSMGPSRKSSTFSNYGGVLPSGRKHRFSSFRGMSEQDVANGNSTPGKAGMSRQNSNNSINHSIWDSSGMGSRRASKMSNNRPRLQSRMNSANLG